jgi:hypothetical protein
MYVRQKRKINKQIYYVCTKLGTQVSVSWLKGNVRAYLADLQMDHILKSEKLGYFSFGSWSSGQDNFIRKSFSEYYFLELNKDFIFFTK